METVGCWVKAAVKDYRSFIKLSGQGITVSRVMNKPTAHEIRKNVHTDSVPRPEVKGGELLGVTYLFLLHHQHFCTAQDK